MTSNELVAASSTSTAVVVELAAEADSSAYVRVLPSGAVTTPPLATSEATVAPSAVAAASRRAPRATAAATRIGVNIDCIVLDPPVSWLKTSSGRAGASVTRTSSTRIESSSAMIMAAAVVMPCPTSIRGIAKWAWPSVVDGDGDQLRRRERRVGLEVAEVVELGHLRRTGDRGRGRSGAADLRRDGERGPGDDEADEAPSADAVGW